MDVNEFSVQRDTGFFLKFYNETTKYAPFSIPLDESLLNEHVLKNVNGINEFIYICNDIDGRGIIHFGQNAQGKTEGNVFLLIADKTGVAVRLLQQAEKKLQGSGINYIKCFPWYPNPYQFILYGAEAFCWAGLYPTNNAFRRLSYDIDLDIVVMNLKMNARPVDTGFENKELEIKELFVKEDELVASGQFIAYHNGSQVGRSGYYKLKAISSHIGKGYGQIDIWISDEYHGTKLGKYLIALAHQKLYDLDVCNVILATNQNFFRAIKFYEALGYKAETIRAYCYSKELRG